MLVGIIGVCIIVAAVETALAIFLDLSMNTLIRTLHRNSRHPVVDGHILDLVGNLDAGHSTLDHARLDSMSRCLADDGRNHHHTGPGDAQTLL